MIQRLELFWKTYFDFQYGVALIIGIVLFGAFITVWICMKRRRGEAVEAREAGCILLLCIYLTFLFGVTLFNRHPGRVFLHGTDAAVVLSGIVF